MSKMNKREENTKSYENSKKSKGAQNKSEKSYKCSQDNKADC